MKKPIHALAGSVAFLTILSFWISTVVAELFFPATAVADVKRAILYGLLLLLPSLMATGGTGALLARSRSGPLVEAKQRRMRILAANGLLIMLPAAVFLHHKAARGELDTGFYLVQVIELAIGAAQLVLLVRNFRDGLRLRAMRPAAMHTVADRAAS